MSKRQKQQEKLLKLGRKRQDFKALFAERFIPALAVCTVICILLAVILKDLLVGIYMEVQNTHYDLTISAATQNIYSDKTEDKTLASQRYRDTLALQLYLGEIGSNVFKLYEDDEEILRTERKGFAIVKYDGGEAICYSDPSAFDKAYEVAGKYIGKSAPFHSEMVLTLADTIYADVDKGIFVPGKMHIERYEFATDLSGNTSEAAGSTVEEFDITPADTTGLTEYTKDQFSGGWVMGDYPENGRLESLDAIDSEQSAGGVISRSKNNSMTWQDHFSVNSWFRTNLNAPDGTVYTVTALYRQDFSERYWGILLAICAVMLVICIVVSLLRAYRMSMIYKAHYAMEDYRRDMTNILAHDLKTPLMTISGCAEMLSDSAADDKTKRRTAMILDNVRYMDDMITNVLDLSRLEMDADIHKVRFDMANAAKDAAAKYSDGHTVNISGSGMITADRQLMTQAADNLISNAVKYSSDGNVDVTVTDKAFTVKNRISGSIEDVDKLWQPYVKGDKARSNMQGSGLGLHIVRVICDKHGFDCSIDAENGIFTAQIYFK